MPTRPPRVPAIERPAREEDDFARLSSERPLVLFPVRIETRFQVDEPRALLLRIYPDEISADSHDARLTEGERTLGESYWRKGWLPASEPQAWRELVQLVSAPRAGWIVRATTPTNFASRPAGAPMFPSVPTRGAEDVRPAFARLLPERWFIVCSRDGKSIYQVATRPVARSLALSWIGEHAALSWLVDFDRAVEAGMAARIPLQSVDVERGFDRIVVVGASAAGDPAAELTALLTAHRHTRGLACVPPGTPTNNTADAPSGFPPEDADGAISFAAERGAAPLTVGSDGARLARALGLAEDTFRSTPEAARTSDAATAAMNDATWPATLGYFLEQQLAPAIDPALVGALRDHFAAFVRAGGPYPILRVGASPYGVLPTTSLARWKARAHAPRVATALPEALRRLLPFWRAAVPSVPRVGRSEDPDVDLVEALALDASSREYGVRAGHSKNTIVQLHALRGLDATAVTIALRQTVRAVLAQLGVPEWEPRIASIAFEPDAPRLDLPLIARTPFDEVAWLGRASLDELAREFLPPEAARPTSLLFRLLRHAMLLVCASSAIDLLEAQRLATASDRVDPDAFGLPGDTRATIWSRLSRAFPGLTGSRSLAELLLPRDGAPAARAPGIARMRRNFARIESLGHDDRERAFTESLDLASHRLDAWITSLASGRLEELRARTPRGVHAGAYGCVEELRAARAPRSQLLPDGRAARIADGGGFVHAPSMRHAATAAVLRNAQVSAEDGRYAVVLSSARVRGALEVLDAVRSGEPLGAILGRRFERGLHERAPGGALLRYMGPLRALFAIDGGEVVDGVRLHDAWRSSGIPFGSRGLPASGPDREALELELAELGAVLDALGDLLVAESVYQTIGGSPEAAAASIDALGRGERPPDPEVARTPRGGATLTHRVLVLMDGAQATGWPSVATPRSSAEPALDAWLGAVLGPSDDVPIVVEMEPRGAAPERREITLATLGLRPIDLLAIVPDTPGTLGEELEQRVHRAAFGEPPSGARVAIAPAQDRSTRSLSRIAAVVRAVRASLGAARGCTAEDLALPGVSAAEDDAEAVDALARARRAEAALATARARLAEAAAATRTGGATADELGALRAALIDLSSFGLPVHPRAGADESHLVELAALGLSEAERRVEAARAAYPKSGAGAAEVLDASLAVARAVFGRAFLLIAALVVTDDVTRALGDSAVLAGDPRAPERWIEGAASVRPALARWHRAATMAATFGSLRPSYLVGQIPHVAGARWAALPFSAGVRPTSGRVSFVVHRLAPARASRWVGVLLDEWSEIIPAPTVDTGLVFHYDDPGAEAPQAVLLAVPPSDSPSWDLETVVDIVEETIDLAKVRAVDRDRLGALGHLLPAIHLAFNSAGDTVSTSFVDALVEDDRPVRGEA